MRESNLLSSSGERFANSAERLLISSVRIGRIGSLTNSILPVLIPIRADSNEAFRIFSRWTGSARESLTLVTAAVEIELRRVLRFFCSNCSIEVNKFYARPWKWRSRSVRELTR